MAHTEKIAELFSVGIPAINKHLKNIFTEGELKENSGISILEIPANDGRVLSSDVTVAKNYLSEKDIKKLERTVSGFFDYIENLIENRQSFTMAEFAESVNKFLNFNEYKILDGKGKISMKQAEDKALSEYTNSTRLKK